MDDTRPKHPGASQDDPYCADIYCPSFFSCRRAQWEPYQGPKTGTITIFSKPDGNVCCSWFDPDAFNPIARRDD
jgi:hypothetical protein